jgi:hypothetical protein
LEWNSMWTFLFFTIPVYWLVHIFVLQKSIVKSGCTIMKNNYIGICIIKLLMYNQFQILSSISFIKFIKGVWLEGDSHNHNCVNLIHPWMKHCIKSNQLWCKCAYPSITVLGRSWFCFRWRTKKLTSKYF